LEGWNPAEDGLTATDEFGDINDNSKAWAINFDKLEFEKLKVESADKTYSREYGKNELDGTACKDIEFLGEVDRIKECGGVNVYLWTNNDEKSGLEEVKYELFDVSIDNDQIN